MRSFEGAIAAVQRRVRRLRPPDHRARPTMRRGFFPVARRKKRSRTRKSFEGPDDGFRFRSRRRRATRDELHDWKRLGIETTRRTRSFGDFGRLRFCRIIRLCRATTARSVFSRHRQSIVNQNQSTFASVPSLFASDSSRSACSASRSAAYWSASAHTGWDANPASPPLILGGCA